MEKEVGKWYRVMTKKIVYWIIVAVMLTLLLIKMHYLSHGGITPEHQGTELGCDSAHKDCSWK